MISCPLLRWAGGKRWLSKKLLKMLPLSINNYYEPFCGSAASFYAINEKLIGKKVFLSDTNSELINFYNILKTEPRKMVKYLHKYENTEEFYYKIRSKKARNEIEAASIFYYLNRTSFNGIYRVNLNGVYNVPYGFKTYDNLFHEDLILKHSELLTNVDFVHSDFSWIEKKVKKNDFVFIDPPYTVSHNINGFIKYNKKLFSLEDQERLKTVIDFIDRKGAHYLLTNAHHEVVHKIFSPKSKIIEIKRYTSISGAKDGRKQTMEYIFCNYEVRNE